MNMMKIRASELKRLREEIRESIDEISPESYNSFLPEVRFWRKGIGYQVDNRYKRLAGFVLHNQPGDEVHLIQAGSVIDSFLVFPPVVVDELG